MFEVMINFSQRTCPIEKQDSLDDEGSDFLLVSSFEFEFETFFVPTNSTTNVEQLCTIGFGVGDNFLLDFGGFIFLE